MNVIQKVLRVGHKSLIKNSPMILTAAAITGLITTSVMASKATLKAQRILQNERELLEQKEDRVEKTIAMVKLVWPLYLPPVIIGASSIFCIIAAHKVQARRAAAIAGAYAITETAFREYQDEVSEFLGSKKEIEIKDNIIKKKLIKSPPSNDQVIITNGDTLCYDALSGRYFRADIEKVRRAINDANNQLYRDDSISLNELYYLMGLPPIDLGNNVGWTLDDAPVEANFSSHLLDGEKPTLAINFTTHSLYAI
jgi:hypothetical protein